MNAAIRSFETGDYIALNTSHFSFNVTHGHQNLFALQADPDYAAIVSQPGMHNYSSLVAGFSGQLFPPVEPPLLTAQPLNATVEVLSSNSTDGNIVVGSIQLQLWQVLETA